MNIGEALVLCTVLVLGVFRPDFRKFLLWTVGAGAALCILAAGIWWARSAYQSHVEQAASAKHRATTDACVKRLTGIDPKNTPDTLPVGSAWKGDWFATVDACEKDPETARVVPDYQRIACESGANDPACNHKPYGSVIEIRGGETLKVRHPANPPKGVPIDLKDGLIPIVYLGHNQQFVFSCGVFGEQGESPTVTSSTITCP